MRVLAIRSPGSQPSPQTAGAGPEGTRAPSGLVDRRPEAARQRQLADFVHRSPRAVAQRKRQADVFAPNRTGLPAALKSGVEQLSGLSLDHVRVHRNSPKPAQVQAHAYAQGSEIHLAPGQEKHLAHEAWHVVQQAQGRVRPTIQRKGGVSINDDRALETEADLQGAKAMQFAASVVGNLWTSSSNATRQAPTSPSIIQRTVDEDIVAAQVNWKNVTALTDQTTKQTLPAYEQRIKNSSDAGASQGLVAWTKNHLGNTQASLAELDTATRFEAFGGVRSSLAPSVSSMSDLRVMSSAVDMPVEVKTSSSHRQGDIDALIKDAHRQLNLSRSHRSTGATTWRVEIIIDNVENPWPYTPQSLPSVAVTPLMLGEVAQGRSLRHEDGMAPLSTQVRVQSIRFGTFQFAI